MENEFIKYVTCLGVVGAIGLSIFLGYEKDKSIENKEIKKTTTVFNKYRKDFSQDAADVYEQSQNMIKLLRNNTDMDLGLLDELVNVFSDGSEAIITKSKVESDLEFFLNESSITGKLLRSYHGPKKVPMPNYEQKKKFERLCYTHKRWSGVINQLIDDNNDGNISNEELNKAIYKTIR